MIQNNVLIINILIGFFSSALYLILFENLNYKKHINHKIADFISYIFSFICNKYFFFQDASLFSEKMINFFLISLFTTYLSGVIVSFSNFENDKIQISFNFITKIIISYFITIPLRDTFVYSLT